MLIEAAKGGHTTVVNLLLDWPNNVQSPSPDLEQHSPPQSKVDISDVSMLVVTQNLDEEWYISLVFKSIFSTRSVLFCFKKYYLNCNFFSPFCLFDCNMHR